ncbi:MAG TPA: aromatic ring-hydroxylating dioxygenase subunit alpha [Stellaceae bacterium]|jgi:vanillate O-demethylase monooxygenase subunit|nr:aromatic ring-hydroxylating dioxygenase subunit alpha [Stellaceae bacterium]
MFIRNAWYVAAWGDELAQAPLARRICDEAIVLFRDKSGTAAAIADRCCHRGTPLSLGEVTEQGLQCGYHGMVFDGAGRCVHIPGQDKIPDKASVPSYPLVERDHLIWLWMGEAAHADPSRIPDVSYLTQWPERHGRLPIQASYLLMVDNLMDLTHLGYVHRRTIGGNPSQHVDAKMETVPTQDGLRYTRWMLNSPPPPTYVKAYGFTGRVDRWQEFEWVAPSSVLQWTGAKDAGTGAYDGDRDGGFQFKLFHGLTPETETTCHYYFATTNGWAPDDDAASDLFFRESRETFLEDKHVVEQQQARLAEFGEDWLVDIVSDATRIRMRRHLNQMLDGEQRRAAE